MKKIIFALVFITLAMVFSLTVMAQSNTENNDENSVVTDNAANEVLQDAGYATVDVQLDTYEYCGQPYLDCPKDFNQLPGGCCQIGQFQSIPDLTQDETEPASVTGSISSGCCSR